MLDDDDLEVEILVLQPMRHNRWAVIVPLLDLAANIAGDVERTFKQLGIFSAQHGMQKHYDERFKEVLDGGYAGIRSREVFPED